MKHRRAILRCVKVESDSARYPEEMCDLVPADFAEIMEATGFQRRGTILVVNQRNTAGHCFDANPGVKGFRNGIPRCAVRTGERDSIWRRQPGALFSLIVLLQ